MNSFQQILGRTSLDQEGISASRQCLSTIRGVHSQYDDSNVRPPPLYESGGLQAIYNRHLDIYQHSILQYIRETYVCHRIKSGFSIRKKDRPKGGPSPRGSYAIYSKCNNQDWGLRLRLGLLNLQPDVASVFVFQGS
jgi:hypothetical protein